jgi:Flp pilus assembly protein TadD
LNPSYANALYNLGTVLLKRQDYRAALEPLTEATRLTPHWGDAWYNLGAVYAHLGEQVNAVQALKRAIELNPALASEARQDRDFQSLRTDAEFSAILDN